jgi:hypothetical protein
MYYMSAGCVMRVETAWCAASGGCDLASQMHVLLLRRAMEVVMLWGQVQAVITLAAANW